MPMGGGIVESVDVTASTTSIPMNTGIAILYIKSNHTPRSIAVVENGAIKWYNTLSYSAPTVTYSSNQLIMGDSIYASQPEAIDYIAF